jgi:translation elongation factor EF-G
MEVVGAEDMEVVVVEGVMEVIVVVEEGMVGMVVEVIVVVGVSIVALKPKGMSSWCLVFQ